MVSDWHVSADLAAAALYGSLALFLFVAVHFSPSFAALLQARSVGSAFASSLECLLLGPAGLSWKGRCHTTCASSGR